MIDSKRLAKLLAMMASPHDGEALNAARMATEMVKESGLTWPDLLAVKREAEPAIHHPPHWAEAERILAQAGRGVKLDGFERRFLTGILGFRTLSSAQEKTLAGIARKVAVANAA